MIRTGSLLTGLMLLAAQVPWVACPEAGHGAVFPALGEEAVHGHVHEGHGHADCRCHHHHGHAHHAHHAHPHPHRAGTPVSSDGPTCECAPHTHGLLTTQLVADAQQVELPAPLVALAVHVAALSPNGDERRVREGAAGPEPPPDRPPSATCLEDEVRLLS